MLSIACLSSIAFFVLKQAYFPEHAIAQNGNGKPSRQEKLTDTKIKQKAEQVTIQIKTIQNKPLGTAVIVSKNELIEVLQNGEKPRYLYDVLTANHVIREPKKQNEKIVVITPDKITRNISLDSATQIGTNDIAIFQIVSANEYPTAKLGSSDDLDEVKVFSAGFPCEENLCNDEIKFTSGITAPEEILEGHDNFRGGFKIGHDSELYDGMSGSPIFDNYGFVVGINSRKKYPTLIFANNEYLYPDGSRPSKIIQEFIPYFAWGIPIEKYIHHMYEKKYISNEYSNESNIQKQVKTLRSKLNLQDSTILLSIIVALWIIAILYVLKRYSSNYVIHKEQSKQAQNNAYALTDREIGNSELTIAKSKIKICELEIYKSYDKVLFASLSCLDGQGKYIKASHKFSYISLFKTKSYRGHYLCQHFAGEYEIILTGYSKNEIELNINSTNSNIFVEILKKKTQVPVVDIKQKKEANKDTWSVLVSEESLIAYQQGLVKIELEFI